MAYEETTLTANDGEQIFLRTWTPDAEARGVVIIIHGLGEHAGRYTHLVNAGLERGFVFLGHDHRGFGRSGGKRGDYDSFEQILIDIDQVVELARGRYAQLPLSLFAHSLGGMYGTHYLARHEDKIAAAVLSAPGYGPGPDFSPFMAFTASILNRLTPNLSIQTGDHDEFNLSHCPDARQAYFDDELYHHTVTIRFAHHNLQKAKEAKALLATLSLPVLLIMGEEDTTIDRQAVIEAAAQTADNVTFRRYAGCLHELHNERVDLRQPVLESTLAWLEETLSLAAGANSELS